MTCPSCGVETKGISLNGKVYCSQCGNDLGVKAELQKPEPRESKPDFFEIPEPKIIEKEKEAPEPKPLITKIEAKEEVVIPEAVTITSEVSESEKLRKTEETLDALMNEYFRPKKVEIAPSKTTQVTTPPKSNIDDELKDIEKEILETSRIVKANRPRINKPIGIAKKSPTAPTDAPKEDIPEEEAVVANMTTEEKPPVVPVETPADTPKPAENDQLPQQTDFEAQNLTPEPITSDITPENATFDTPVVVETQAPEPEKDGAEEAEITTMPQKSGISVNLMQAEKGYCVKCKQTREIIDPKDVTLKNGHFALKGTCAVCGTAMFKIKKGLNEDIVAKNKKKKNSSHLLTSFFQQKAKEAQSHKKQMPESKELKKVAQPVKKSAERKHFFLFGKKKDKKQEPAKIEKLKSEPTKEEPRVSEKPKIKKKHPLLKKVIIALLIIIIPIASFMGFVYYVTNFAANAEKTKANAELATKFSYNKPSYLPAGYTLSFKTNASSNFIEYIYEYEPDKNKLLKIKITNQDIKEEDFLNTIVKPNGEKYTTSNVKETEVWFVEDKGAFFVKDGVIYEITNSDKISKDELTKIVDSLI